MVPTGLLILGFGGHARSVGDIALAAGVRELRFVEASARDDERFLDHRVVRDYPAGVLSAGWQAFPAIGDAQRRRQQIDDILRRGWPLATLVAPDATLGAGAQVGAGSLVARHAHIGPLARIGTGAIINTAAVVEHECVIGDDSHISVNATVAGRTRIGARCMIGAGAVVIDGIAVCDDVTVGAGAVVYRAIEMPGVYVGNPLRRVG